MTDQEIVAKMNRIRAFNRGWDSCMAGGPYETSIYRYGSTEYAAYQKCWLSYARRVVEANKNA